MKNLIKFDIVLIIAIALMTVFYFVLPLTVELIYNYDCVVKNICK
jgi:hypothetical protein